MAASALQRRQFALSTGLWAAWPAWATDYEAQSRALSRATQAVVGVASRALEGAGSATTLGPVRLGSGTLISADGLVLTIGYLILEAEQVLLLLDGSNSAPARVVAYDQATGLGLLQALVPLKLPHAELGNPESLRPGATLVAVSGAPSSEVDTVQLLSQRPFSGYWEYHIEQALFTQPPHAAHSGAGLFDSKGQLVGVGSLLLADAAGPQEPRRPGNLFVPVSLLKPHLAQMRREGRSEASQRAWLGLNCVEAAGMLRIVRVTRESPAQSAGLAVGDRILAIDGHPVASLSELWKRLWSGAVERPVQLDIERGGDRSRVQVHSIDRASSLSKPQGV